MLKALHGDVGGSEGRSEVPEKVNRPSAGLYTVLNPDAEGASDPRTQSFLHLIERSMPTAH